MKRMWPTWIVVACLLIGCQCAGPQSDFSTMSDQELLDHASGIAFQRLADAGDDMEGLSDPYRTIAIIYSAQGVINNGGLQFFFENDWTNQPRYSVFADAYERIGRTEAAKAIREAADSFGSLNPEKDQEARRAYIRDNYNDETSDIDGWNDCICGDEKVWTDLAAWTRGQPEFK